MLQRTAGSACFSLPMSRLYPRGESATLRAELSEEGMQMKKQLRGLFCAAALAAVLALPARAAEQTHRAYLCGYPDGSIQPGAPVTRAQLACALVRLAEEPLPEGAVENYLASRERKLRLSDAMFQALEETADGQFRVLIGIDDSSEEDSIQKNEIAYLRAQLRQGDALLSGVDDLAFKAVTKLCLEEWGWEGAAVSVQYFGGTEDRPACAYDYQPLEAIVAEHFDFFDLTMAEPGGEELAMLVLTQPADPAAQETYINALVQCLNDNRAAGLPTILIDAGNGTYGTAFHKALTDQAELGWLLSYAGFLDMAIVTGTALSHGVARYAFLQHGEQTDATEQAFLRTLADSILKDFCYKNIVRNDILSFVRNDLSGNADNFWMPDIDRVSILERLEAGMAGAVAPVIENLERSNFISSLSATREYAERGWGGVELTGYGFPWDRAFEISMEIRLGAFTEPHKALLGIYYK